MAPTDRFTGVSSTIWALDGDYVKLSPAAKLLYFALWTSEDRDAAGVVPLQFGLLAKTTGMPEAETRKAADELVEEHWLIIDADAERVWLSRFIEHDTFNSPNLYVSALTNISSCSSRMIREAAWVEVQRLGLPPVKSDKPEVRERMYARMSSAYDKLRERVSKDSRNSSERVPERVSKLCNVKVHAHADEDEHSTRAQKPPPDNHDTFNRYDFEANRAHQEVDPADWEERIRRNTDRMYGQ